MRIAVVCAALALAAGVHAQEHAAILEAQSLPDLPAGVRLSFVGTSGGALIVAGGRNESGVFSDRIYALAPDGEGWAPAWIDTTLPVPLVNGASVSVDDSFVLIGGMARERLTAVIRLRWRDGELRQDVLPDLPAPRVYAAAAALGNTIYLSGGAESQNDEFESSLWALDLDEPEPTWERLAPWPAAGRLRPRLVAQAGALYLVGGLERTDADGWRVASSMWSYRPTPFDGTRQQGWVEAEPPPVALEDLVLFASGQSHVVAIERGTEGPSVLSYHTVTDTWVKAGVCSTNTLGAGAAAWQGGVALVGGGPSRQAGTQASLWKLTSRTETLHWVDYAAIGAYLIVLIGIGAHFSRGERSSEDFFLGGRRIPWWAAGISLYATGTSAISFMAIPTKTYVTNQVYGLGSLWSPVFWMPAAFIIIPLIRRLDLTSTYEYLERRFGVAVRLLGSALCVAFQVGGRMSIVLLLPAMALSAVTGLDVLVSVALMGLLATVYTVMGGIEAVIWTDVLQCVVLLGGGLLAFALMVHGLDDGWATFASINQADGKFTSFMWGWDWTIPVFWIFTLSSLTQLATFPNDQVMVQRVLATPDPKSARNSAIVLAVIVVPGTILFHLLGSALYAHFQAHPENLSPTMENIHTLPLFIVQSMPVGVTGLVIAGLFAASMSSLDSSMSSTATVVVTDFYRRFRPDADDRRCLRLARWLTGGIGVLGTGVALLMATFEIKSLYDMWVQLFALLGGGFAGVYALGMLTRRAHGNGALAGALASVVLTVLTKAYTPVHFMLYGVVSVVSCVCVGYVASLILPGRRVDLAGLTVYTRQHDTD
jgi:SSS family transporter